MYVLLTFFDNLNESLESRNGSSPAISDFRLEIRFSRAKPFCVTASISLSMSAKRARDCLARAVADDSESLDSGSRRAVHLVKFESSSNREGILTVRFLSISSSRESCSLPLTPTLSRIFSVRFNLRKNRVR